MSDKVNAFLDTVENMSKELVRVIKYKRRGVATVVTEGAETVNYYKPRSNTSVWRVLMASKEPENKNNPFIKKFMAERFDSDLWVITSYATDGLGERWPEFEAHLLIQLKATIDSPKQDSFHKVMSHLLSYCDGLNVVDWPELEAFLAENMTSRTVKLKALQVRKKLASLNDRDWTNGEIYINRFMQIAQAWLFLNRNNPEKQVMVIEPLELFFKLLHSLPSNSAYWNLISSINITMVVQEFINSKHPTLVSAAGRLLAYRLEQAIKHMDFIQTSPVGENSNDDNPAEAIIYMHRYIPKAYDSFMALDDDNKEKIKQLLTQNVVRYPETLIAVAADFGIRFPESVEDAMFKTYSERLSERFKREIATIEREDNWSSTYWCRHLERDSGLRAVYEYVEKCIKNRTRSTDMFFMRLAHKGCFREYVSVLTKLAKAGIKINPI
jgi:hypothetical protein